MKLLTCTHNAFNGIVGVFYPDFGVRSKASPMPPAWAASPWSAGR